MARAPVTDEVEFLDEEFLHHLNRGADLLASGDAAGAVTALQRARELRPSDPQVLGLAGQALYKVGRFEDAIDAYQQLVDASPAEAAARVNLGLANLRARRYPHAIRQLEIALELSPDHQRAMRYLGLAWLESSEPARAREWFERAGSAEMVARCDELIGAGASAVRPDRETEQTSIEDDPDAAPLAGASAGRARDAVERVPQVSLGGGANFSRSRDLLTVAVRDEVLVRAEGLLAVQGGVRLAAAMKRFRGAVTEKPFGDGARRMLRASGCGELVYTVGARRLATVDLSAEAGYFRDDVVFAFQGQLTFENGRIASRPGAGGGLDVVHLRGEGQVLLASTADVVAVTVGPGAPIRVHVRALAGWTGALTPQLTTLAVQDDVDGSGGDRAAVELTGTGRVLLEGGAAG